MTPVHFTTGFSDFFSQLASGTGGSPLHPADPTEAPQIIEMFDRFADYNARTIRIQVDWNQAETPPGTYEWSKYAPVAAHAAVRGLRVLPQVWGAPHDPAHPPSFPTNNTSHGVYYPTTDAGYTAFGEFVAETLAYFGGTWGVSNAVEVWNEPNLAKYLGSDASYKKMLNAALVATKARAYPFDYTVVSGGLAMTNPNWQAFLDEFTYYNQCFTPYAVGIHPYAETADYSTSMPRAEAVAQFVADVKANFRAARERWNWDFWITEFGCPGGPPFDEAGRADALQQLVGAGKYFDQRPRCKAMILYRLFPQGFWSDDTPVGKGWWWDHIPLLNLVSVVGNVYTFSEAEPVQQMLSEEWPGAPSVV